MIGYNDNPDATRATIDVDGWLHTGDLGTMDAQGFIRVTGRVKDMIIRGGENLFPAEIEAVLVEHSQIAQVCIIGLPDEKWGETIKALVVLADGESVNERDLIDHCRDQIAHFKCPTSVEFRDELASTATGKLQKFKLRSPYWEGMDRQVN